MSTFDFDLIIIGGGSGGVRAARLASERGARVAIVEESRIGGTCVIRGCVPKKLLVYSSHFAEDFKDAAGYGWTVGSPSFDWPRLIAAKNAEVDRLSGLYQATLNTAGARLLAGHGALVDAHTVTVDGRHYTARRILIAVGARPSLPDIPGIEHVITSDQALDLMTLPRRIVIVGGGYIAIEFAALFHNLGLDVTQIIRADALLRGFDSDLRRHMTEMTLTKGIDLRTGTVVHSIEKKPEQFCLHLRDGRSLETDLVFYATGRRANTQSLGLQAAGITVNDDGTIPVDTSYATSVPSVYAIGDAVGRKALTPVALAEASVFVRSVWDGDTPAINYDIIPAAVFSQPPLASVGLSEDEARDRKKQVQVYVSQFKPMRNTLAGREERSFIKMIVDAGDRTVLGCHMIGPEAPEIMQGMAIALSCRVTKEQVDATIGIHPTLAEELVTLRTPREGPSP